MPNAFLEKRAKLLVLVDVYARENSDPVLDRAFELMAKPELRDPEIVVPTLDYYAERREEATDNAEEAYEYRLELAEWAALTWEQINSVPGAKRGLDYNMHRAMILDLCHTQAQLEFNGQFNLDTGEQLAIINKSAANRLSDAQKQTIAVTGGVVETPGEVSAEIVEEEDDGEEKQ